MYPNNASATDVIPLLLLIYGMISVAVVYGLVLFVQQHRKKSLSSDTTTTTGVVRDTVNQKEIKTTYDSLISTYDKKILELNAHLSTGSVLNPEDIQYIISQLQPHSTIWDVLSVCLTTPTTMEWAITDYNRVRIVRQQRIEYDTNEERKRNPTTTTTTTSTDSHNHKDRKSVV